MKKEDYFRDSLKKSLPLNIGWMKRCFMTIKDDKPHEFVFVKNGKIYVNVDGKETLLDDAKVGEPLFNPNNTITLFPDILKCLKKDVKTTYGIALANMVLLDFGLEGKMEYINGEVSISDIENGLLEVLKDEPLNEAEKKPDEFYTSDIEQLSRADMCMQEWAHIFTISRSEKAITPPPGLDAFKKKTIMEMKKKYGDKLFTEEVHAIEYIDTIKAYYKAYLESDPTLGIVLSNKVLNDSLMMRKVAFGYQKNPFNPDTPDLMILKSLEEGMELTEDAFPHYVNSSRSGSYFRGVATQQSGTIAKNLVLATMSLKYVDGDCGTKRTRRMLVEDPNSYKTRYIIENGKLVNVEDCKKYKGKFIELRDPMYCNAKVGGTCRICAGEMAYKNPNAVVLQSTQAGGDLVNGDMKKMHGSVTKAITLDF